MPRWKKRFSGATCRWRPDDECVEIGCAPGGASQALLDRGLFVTGIDPADVDPAVLEHPRFRHLKKRGKEVRRQEFLGVRWLAADMNIAPEATLDEVEAIVTHPGVTIRGMVLTLKFSDWSVAERLPEFVGARARLGISRRADAATRDAAGRKCAWSRCGGRRCGGWAAKLSRKRKPRRGERRTRQRGRSRIRRLPGPHF